MQLPRRFCALFAFAFLGGCAPAPAPSSPDATDPSPRVDTLGNSQSADRARIVALEEQAKSIARTSGCSRDSECRSAPVGVKACGGPRYYLPYCARTTDSAALFRKLDEVLAAERAFNVKYGMVSNCQLESQPTVGVTAGVCQAR